MHSHIAIEGPTGTLALSPSTDLTITDKNPMFNDVEMFSQPIQLPLDLNRHLVKNVDDVNSSLRAADIEQSGRYHIIIDGIPCRTATMKAQENVKLAGVIDVNFDATNRTFKEMIADLRCRDVPVDEDILIGEKVGDVHLEMNYQEIFQLEINIDDGSGGWLIGYEIKMKPIEIDEMFQPFALGFSYPAECYEDATTHKADPDPDTSKAKRTYPNPNSEGASDITVNVPHVKTSYINVAQPYPYAKYCNSRIAYAHHKAKMEDGKPTGETDSEIVPANERKRNIPEDKSPYWVLDAKRPASGICFYVAYFLERLFKKLGVAYDMSALTDIEDFNYLAFFNTGCHYDAKPKGDVVLTDEAQINDWLDSRGCGGKISYISNLPEESESMMNKGVRVLHIGADEFQSWSVLGNHGYYNQFVSTDLCNPDGSITVDYMLPGTVTSRVPNCAADERYLNAYRSYDVSVNSMTAKVMQMFANADNFPDADVSEVIESLENSFGVRFCYDAEANKVTVRLLRDMFRDTQQPVKFKGIVTTMVKNTEIIKGIRMRYAAESDANEQRDNIRYGKRDYDTIYDYMDYPQRYTKFATFEEVTNNIDVGNRTGYCDMRTGDFFRIKVSSDASTVAELRPSVFEVGAMHGVELGDCSEEAEKDGRIKEFVSGFVPIEVNDVAYRGLNYADQEDPLLVPFIDEDMEHEFLVKKLLNPVSTRWGNIDIIYELCLAECYDPTKTDDGQSPLQHHDWGLTIGFLRPDRNPDDVDVMNYDRNYDGFDNSKWLLVAKNYTFNADSFDEHANFLGDPNAPQHAFSLKPRAYKPFRYKYDNEDLLISTDPKQWETEPGWLIPCNDDEKNSQSVITKRIRSRGMADTWLPEFFHFLLHRQRYHIEAICTAAELADIPNKWLRRWDIDGKIGWINTLTYPASVQNGLGKVEIDFFAL